MVYSIADALMGLEKAVALKGADYTYERPPSGCAYSYRGQPSCIVGHVVADLDKDAFEQIINFEGTGGSFPALNLGNDGYPPVPFMFTEQAASVLYTAQCSQDSGDTWGSALARARRRASQLGYEPTPEPVIEPVEESVNA